MGVKLIIFQFLQLLSEISLAVTIFGIPVMEDYLEAALVPNSASSPNKLPKLQEKGWELCNHNIDSTVPFNG
jgi:hypothetical protein